MKNLFYFLIVGFLLLSCNRNDETQVNKVAGEWKLIQSKTYVQNSNGQNELQTTDYSSQNIIYNFQTNNQLKITGSQNDGLFPYEFKNDYLGGNSEGGKIDLVIIQSTKYIFTLNGNQLSLDNKYVDGPELIFQKK
ncbi:MAG: hypothetical protein ACK40Y_10625 [Cloacibacterium caeni]